MAVTSSKEYWGVKFSIVPNGLAEEEVVSYVNGLMEKSRQSGSVSEQQSSLVKLAEQTVIEADRLAERIKDEARKAAEAEADKILKAASDKAHAEANKLLQKAEKDSASQAGEIVAKAQREAQDTADRAAREAQGILDKAHEGAEAMQSEARLEAEFVVRRTAAQLADEIRASLNDVSHGILADLERPAASDERRVSKGNHSGAANAAIPSPRG